MSSTKVNQEHVKQLINLGFSKSKSEKALKDYKNNLNQAKNYLIRSKQEEETKIQKEADLKEKIKIEEQRKKDEKTRIDNEKLEEEAKKKYEADLEKAIQASMMMTDLHPHQNQNNNHSGYYNNDNDDEDDSYHPCITQYGKCRYGVHCAWKDYPGDSCINYLQGSCIYGDQCRNRHFWRGEDLRAGLRPIEKNQPIEIQDPNDPRSTIVIRPGAENGSSKVSVAERIANENYENENENDDEYRAEQQQRALLASELHRFNPEATSKPSYSMPVNNDNHTTEDDSNNNNNNNNNPTPFLDKMKELKTMSGENNNSNSSLSFNVSTASKISQPANTTSSSKPGGGKLFTLNPKKIPKHPCVYQRGDCKYGDTCVHADLPGDICVHYLNHRCKFDEDTCHFKHHFYAAGDEKEVQYEELKRQRREERERQVHKEEENQKQEQPLLNMMNSQQQQQSNSLIDHSSTSSTSNAIQRQLLDILGATNVAASGKTDNNNMAYHGSPTSSFSTSATNGGAIFSSGTLGGFNVSSSSSNLNSNQQVSSSSSPSLWSASAPIHQHQHQQNYNNSSSSNTKLEIESREQFAFSSLRSAFPQAEPAALILALRRCNGDVKRAGSCVLDLEEGAKEYVSEYYEHHLPEFIGETNNSISNNQNQQKSSSSSRLSEEDKTIAIVLLSSLCPSFEPSALQDLLESNNWNFEDAFAETNVISDEQKKNNTKHQQKNNKITSSAVQAIRAQSSKQKLLEKSPWFQQNKQKDGAANKSSTSKLTPSLKLQLDKLIAMYDELDSAVIEHSFRACEFEIETTRALLLQMAEDCKEYSKKEQKEKVKSREQMSISLLSQNSDSSSGNINSIIFGSNNNNGSSSSNGEEFLYGGGGGSAASSPLNINNSNNFNNSNFSNNYNTSSSSEQLYQSTKDAIEQDFDWRRARQEASLTNIARQRTAACAVTAFSRGDHQTGAALMRESKQLAARYSRLNMLCMSALEREQDKSANGLTTLDLHGFHVKEAIAVLGRRLKLCREKSIPRLRVVAGRGSHSRDGRGVVLPAALDYVESISSEGGDGGYKWCYVVKNEQLKNEHGSFDVVIRRDY